MDKIKFLKDKNEIIYDVKLQCLIDNRVAISFAEPIDKSLFLEGFVVVNEHNLDFVQGDYSDMKYIYKDCDDGFNFILTTDENDVYIEPAVVELEPIEPYIPTLNEVKKSKINELSNMCNQVIVNGVDVEIGGDIEHFSYKDEDQVNIKELFDLATQTKVPLYYHADGLSCKLYTVEQIVTIYSSNALNKMHHITYFNQLKLYVESLEDKDSISSIAYGDELIGEYLETYNNAMAQANIGLTTLLGE